MPVDWNDRSSVEQALIKARNAGVSDDDFIAYAKEKRLSSAGKTLQKESAFKLHQSRPILSAGGADVLPPGRYQEVLPYILGAPGQAMKEGIDYLAAEKPEDRPTLGGAATRVGLMAAAPAVIRGGAKLLGKSVGVAGPVMDQIAQSGAMKTAKTLYRRIAPGAEEQLGTEVATSTGKALKTMQGSAIAKDAFVEGLNQEGKRIPVGDFAAKLKGAITEAETFGSDTLKQARGRLADMADELISKHENGSVGLGDFMTFKENLGKQLFKATNPVLRQRLGSLGAAADDTLIQELGPGAANHIKALEIATSNRLGLLRKVNKLFRLHPEAVIRKAAGSEEIMRAINELDAQVGTDFSSAISELAAKKAFTPKDMPMAYKLLDRMTRIAGSSAIGFAEGGPAGFLAYLASSPPMRRQAAKLGLLLSTTSIPRLATAAVMNKFSRPEQPPNE